MTEVSDNNSNTDKGQRHDQSWGMATIATMPKDDDDDNDDEDQEHHHRNQDLLDPEKIANITTTIATTTTSATTATTTITTSKATKATTNSFSTVLEIDTWDITKNDIPLPSHVAIRVMDHADMVLQKRLSEATEALEIFHFETGLARFQNSELLLGRRIGWGNFADIYEVKRFLPTSPFQKNCTREQLAAAEELKRTCRPESLVVKVLRAQLLSNHSLYAIGAADVVTEGTLLAALDHPNIVSLRGRSVSGLEGFASGKRDAFFLLFERLDGVLADRMKEWQNRLHQHRIIMGRRDGRIALLAERVQFLAQLADAITYLHERNIIHRDLKLSNVGMDSKGRPKLFDFGLAKILPPNISGKETFLLTTNTGSVRYMAPEIGRGEKYNLKADVFSFAMLLYEVLSLGKVWDGCSPTDIREKVHIRKHRPTISMFWPAPLRDLLKATWSDVPAARLGMKHVHTILCKFLKDMETDSSH